MRFENTSMGMSSFEKPEPGWYIGRLIGFSFIGVQTGGQYGPRSQVMLRWELYLDGKPVLDSKGLIKTITNRFNATVKGEKNNLRSCLEFHGITVNPDEATDSKDWLGHTVNLFVDSKGQYANVTGYDHVSPEENSDAPGLVLKYEHWEPDDKQNPPMWADGAIAKSSTLSHRASAEARARIIRKPTPEVEPPADYGTAPEYEPAPAREAAPVMDEEDDIPF